MVRRYLFNIKPSAAITIDKSAVCVCSCIVSLLGHLRRATHIRNLEPLCSDIMLDVLEVIGIGSFKSCLFVNQDIYPTISSGEPIKFIGNKTERIFIFGLKTDARRMTFGFEACDLVNQLKCIVGMSIAGC